MHSSHKHVIYFVEYLDSLYDYEVHVYTRDYRDSPIDSQKKKSFILPASSIKWPNRENSLNVNVAVRMVHIVD